MPKKLSKKAKKSKVTKPTTKTKPTVKPKTKKRTSIKNSDQIVKNVFLSSPKYALELLSLILPKSFMSKINKQSLELKHDTFIKNAVETRADMVFSFSVMDIAFKVFVVIEHKSYQYKEVPYQLLSYMISVYERHRKEGCIVVPVVLYHGESHNWNAPLNFHECLGLDKIPDNKFLQEHVINFKYKLLNLHDLDVLKLVGKLTIAPFLATLRSSHKIDKEELEELFRRAGKLLSDSKYKEAMQLAIDAHVRFHGKRSYDELINFESQHIKKGSRIMIKYKSYAEEMAEEAAEKAHKKGVLYGRKEGMEAGREEIIRNMLKQGFDLNAVTKAAGLSKAEVNKIKASMKYPNGAKK